MFGSVVLFYLAGVNLAAFAAFGIDKWKAVRHRWRIPEATLLGLSLIGGALGGLAGMRLFHHKTRKARFFRGGAGDAGFTAGAWGSPAVFPAQVTEKEGMRFGNAYPLFLL